MGGLRDKCPFFVMIAHAIDFSGIFMDLIRINPDIRLYCQRHSDLVHTGLNAAVSRLACRVAACLKQRPPGLANPALRSVQRQR